MDNNKQIIKFIRRVPSTEYIEDQTIDTSGLSADVTNLLIGTDFEMLELEIEGRRYVVPAFLTKS